MSAKRPASARTRKPVMPLEALARVRQIVASVRIADPLSSDWIVSPDAVKWLSMLQRWYEKAGVRDALHARMARTQLIVSPADAPGDLDALDAELCAWRDAKPDLERLIQMGQDLASRYAQVPDRQTIRREILKWRKLAPSDGVALKLAFPDDNGEFAKLLQAKQEAIDNANKVIRETARVFDAREHVRMEDVLLKPGRDHLREIQIVRDSAFKQAKRLKFAPVSLTKSFAQWAVAMRKQRSTLDNDLRELAGKVDEYRTREPSIAKALRLRRLVAVLSGLPESDSATNEFSGTTVKLAAFVSIARNGEVTSTLASWMTRLRIAQAALPSMPQDWTKPLGQILGLFVTSFTAFVVIGSLMLGQPLWSLITSADAASHALHPAYVTAVGILFVLAGSAVHRLRRRFAKRCEEELRCVFDDPQKKRDDGESLLNVLRNDMLRAIVLAGLVSATLNLVAWCLAIHPGNRIIGNRNPSLACESNTYALFGKGIVVQTAEHVGASYPTKEPMNVLCSEVKTTEPPAPVGAITLADLQSVAATFAESIKKLTFTVAWPIDKPIRIDVSSFNACPRGAPAQECVFWRLENEASRILGTLDDGWYGGANPSAAKLESIDRKVGAMSSDIHALVRDWQGYRQRTLVERIREDINGAGGE